MSIASDLITLKNVVDEHLFFKIPIYQRLYVWGDSQVETLLQDLLSAYQAKKSIFYLGGVLVVERSEPSAKKQTFFDLIDGQQRFTTLWMMSIILSELLAKKQSSAHPIHKFCYINEAKRKRPRIEFLIRDDVNDYFAARLNANEALLPTEPRLIDAQASILSFLGEQEKDTEFDLADFSDFIYTKVSLVMTSVPAHTDLNKLFEVINNRGIQLQHHEILKARMLNYLPDEKMGRYSFLWEACSYMDQYVEKNLRDIAKVKVSDIFSNRESKVHDEDLASARKVLSKIKKRYAKQDLISAISLDDILNDKVDEIKAVNIKDDDVVYEADVVRSIISFPMLLQHTLRIWLHQNKKPDLPKILDKELLSLFEAYFFSTETSEKDVISFFRLLWEIRYIFDKYIIKWVSVGEEAIHLISQLRLNKSGNYKGLVREKPDTNNGFALLQSMLYHSQQITTHYWLTPLLAYIHNNPGSSSQHYSYLRYLDNHLFCSTDAAALIERTHEFMEDPYIKKQLNIGILNEDKGVGFPHYWFYKLEFILWYLMCKKNKGDCDARWAQFRFTAKNSVEHISPQTRKDIDRDAVTDDVVNNFGNLSLVSRSINSEYSNKPFNEKREHFKNRNVSKVDSLKMDVIYRSTRWGDDYSNSHQQEMIKLMDQYIFSRRGAGDE